MLRSLRTYLKGLINKSGWEVIRREVWDLTLHGIQPDYDKAHAETYDKVKDFTMTSSQRIVSLCNAVDYLEKNNIEGDLVECGVWKGGSIMAAIDTLLKYNSTKRSIYLYDTFEGMPLPTEHDIKKGGISGAGLSAEEIYKNSGPDDLVWCYSSLDEVKQNVAKMGYPAERVHYIKGKVEDTIPGTIPQKIALLRLDTDFYESTAHELEHLYPLLVPGGVLVIDDYGEWEGARKAVDEYITNNKLRILLNRIDSTGRIAVKT